METLVPHPGNHVWSRVRDLTGPVLVWAVWGAMTVAAVLLIRQNVRNIPYMDDFELVPMMTGNEPVSLRWAWAQHNEHRPFISRLILAGAHRFVGDDFRTGMYLNAGLMSAAAVSMLLLARRLRGYTSVTDAVLPLSILSLGQAETLMIAFALNLVLTAWISFELIAAADLAGRRPGWRPSLRFGLFLVLLPLCGGSGLVMLPPLVLWLAGYLARGWWSGRVPGALERTIGLGLIMACSAVVVLYVSDYGTPPWNPPAPSIAASASTTMEFLSQVVAPNVPRYWWPASLIVLILVAATLLRLAEVGLRVPDERPRALGLIAVILSMLAVAAAVGVSRSGLGPGFGLSSRYASIAAPLLSSLYVAWLAYGPAPARRLVNIVLLTLVCLAVPANIEFGLKYGELRRSVYLQVERNLRARVPASQMRDTILRALYPVPDVACDRFNMLKHARFGKFKYFIDDRVAVKPEVSKVVR
jgi:hypothetical protein